MFDTAGGLNDPKQRVRSGGAVHRAEFGLNDWLKFRTITGLAQGQQPYADRLRRATPLVDLDVPAIYKNHQFSQELQMVADKGPLQGVVWLLLPERASAYDTFDVRLYTTCPTVPLPGCVVAVCRA